MATAGGIRMGGVYVEIGADAGAFFASVKSIEKRLSQIGSFSVKTATALRGIGVKLAAAGAAASAPLALAARQSAAFDDALRSVSASTGATTSQIEQVRAAAMGLSKDLGVGPTAIAQSFLELLKAGMPLEQVLGGAGRAAAQFAKVGEMSVAEAGIVMADAMKVFGVDAETAANAISSAADASSTDIHNLSIAFSQVSAVAGLANQTIHDTATALAIMANNGVKGSDAGTSLKTMLLRLMAPSEEANKALRSIGLSTDSFRGADGKVAPLVDVIGTLQDAMKGVDQATRDNIFRDVFGQDAIRAAAILTQTGTEGFGRMKSSMSESLTVGEKFGILMGGLSGASEIASAGVQRLAIAIGDQLSGSFAGVLRFAGNAAGALAEFVSQNGQLVVSFAQAAAVVAGVGGAFIAIGGTLAAVNMAFGAIATTIGSLVLPVVSVIATMGGLALSFVVATVKAVAYGVASVAAAVASGAAWTAANIAMGGAIAFIAVAVTGLVLSTFQAIDVFTLMGNAMAAVQQTAAGAMVTLQELGRIGREAFGAIYESINAGNLEGAMAIAIAGLKDAFTTGSAAFLNEVDKWGTSLLNKFDEILSQIPFLRFVGGDKFTFSVFGDSGAAPFLAEGGDQKGRSLDRQLGMLGRRNERNGAIPGAESAFQEALRAARTANVYRSQAGDVIRSMDQAATFDAMRELATEFHLLADTGKLSTDQLKLYSDAVDKATDRLSEQVKPTGDVWSNAELKKRREQLAMDDQAKTLLDNIGGVKSRSDLEDLRGEFNALDTLGRLSSEQKSVLEGALAQADAMLGGNERPRVEVAGTFSSMNLGNVFGGTSAAERTAKATEEIARNTRDMRGDKVAA